MSRGKNYSFELKSAHGVQCDEDYGRWMNYDTFIAEGDTLDELMENCSGFTMDQDGGEGREVSLDDVREPTQTHLRDELLDAHRAALKKACDEAADFEDGELGMHRCVELWCEKHGIENEATVDEINKYWFKQGALEAGIPLSVIEGRTRLTDHFSEEYINQQCGRTDAEEAEREARAERSAEVRELNRRNGWDR